MRSLLEPIAEDEDKEWKKHILDIVEISLEPGEGGQGNSGSGNIGTKILLLLLLRTIMAAAGGRNKHYCVLFSLCDWCLCGGFWCFPNLLNTRALLG